MIRLHLLITCLFLSFNSFATVFYVSLSGNDATGTGTSASPWRTLRVAVSKVPANQGHTIKILAGTFVETGFINVPTGVNIEESGIGVTILKPSSSMYYKSNAWVFDKSLLILSGGPSGNQSVKQLTIDGDSKQLYGGIMIKDRNNVLIESVRVQYTYFTGIWFWSTLDCRVTQSQLKDCAWGSTGGASGALQASRSERLEVDNMNIDEGYGQAMDAVGSGPMYNLKVHHNRFSVNPVGTWQTPGGVAVPNLAVEFYNVELKNCQVYNNYFDNNLSMVMDETQFTTPTGIQTVRVYNNTFDLIARAGGSGHGVELTLHDAEIDHNYFYGGSTGIANWDASANPHTMQNWKIHHNTFYGISSNYPTAIVNMYKHGVINAHIYNNTVETTGSATVNFIEVNNGGVARNVKLENNLIIDSNTSYQWYPNKFISLSNNATMQSSVARNNFLQKMAIGSVPGVTYSNNFSGDPVIKKTGSRPSPFYEPNSGSPLIDKGVSTGSTFAGSAPDIGAFENGTAIVDDQQPAPPVVSITSPANNASYTLGSAINFTASVTYSGTVSKVEFMNGTTKLGEDTTSPYNFSWANATSGSYQITARVTTSTGTTATSSPVTVSVTSGNQLPTISITSPTNNSTFTTGSTITVEAFAADKDGQIAKVEFFNGATKLGEDLTSPHVFNWSNVQAGTYQLTVKTTDNAGGTGVSSLVTVVVKSADTQPPVISITSPANNSSYTLGTAINLAASVTYSGTISKVEFMNGTTKIGEDTTSPYSYSWSSAVTGTHQVSAKVTTSTGVTVTSSPVTVSVTSGNLLPTISITNPVNNSTFTAGSTITIEVFATDKDGQITKVEFFNGSTKLGEDLVSPHIFNWTNVPAGTYQLTTRTTDNKGATGTSAAITVIVKSSGNQAPSLTINNPLANSTFKAGGAISIKASASDSDGTISKVEFFRNTTRMGQDITSPYTFNWTNIPAGNFDIVVKATDNSGAVTTKSVPVRITTSTGNIVPYVSITSPAQNAVLSAGSPMVISVDASDVDGTVSKVIFYYGSTKIGEDLSSPYAFTWNKPKTGSYKLFAKAVDNQGTVGTSIPVSITVQSATLTAARIEGDSVVMDSIEFSDIDKKMSIPRVFSPNNDGINDVWHWTEHDHENCPVSIFDRAGQKVFETRQYKNNWDGTFNGSALPEDAYFYVGECEGNKITGAVRIIR